MFSQVKGGRLFIVPVPSLGVCVCVVPNHTSDGRPKAKMWGLPKLQKASCGKELLGFVGLLKPRKVIPCVCVLQFVVPDGLVMLL